MKKRSLIPETRVKNPEPKKKQDGWIIWAAWARTWDLNNIFACFQSTRPTA